MSGALSLEGRERQSYIETSCEGDVELRQEILSLLASYDDAGAFLESPPQSSPHQASSSPEFELKGRRMGAYELVRGIGRGGMGEIYLAHRADHEFRKQVAIKVIRAGMESPFAIRRFRSERQILARLEHPNIARLLDGGTSTDGLPYLVMEYIDGEPLLEYCESRALPPRQRIELLLDACAAIHYAHRRMIIHRDLKPGNILVTTLRMANRVLRNLLDFGIAKMLDPGPSDADSTVTGLRLITPAYASPEQTARRAGEHAQRHLFVGCAALGTGERQVSACGERPASVRSSG